MEPGSGYIYLMRLEENTDPWKCAHKVGRSRHPDERMKQLGLVLPYDLTILHLFWARDYVATEKLLHEELKSYHLQGEWYYPEPQWVNFFRTLSQYYIDTGEYPEHEPSVHGRRNDRFDW